MSKTKSFLGVDFFKHFLNLETGRKENEIFFFKHERKNFLRYTIHGKATVNYVISKFSELKNDIYTQRYHNKNVYSLNFFRRTFEKVLCNILRGSDKISSVKVFVKKDGGWGLEKEGSRGNMTMFEDVLFRHSSDFEFSENVLICLQFKSEITPLEVSMAAIKTSTNEMFVSEFMDNENFSNLECVIVQLNISECLFLESKNVFLNEKVINILKYCGVVCTTYEMKQSSKNVQSKLEKLLKAGNVKGISEELKYLKQIECLGCCIDYLNLYRDRKNYGYYKLKPYKHENFVKLDSTVFKSLHILPYGGKNNLSVFQIINKCVTKMGSRRLNIWIRQPLINKEEIEKRQLIVDSFCEDQIMKDKIRSSLKVSPDLDRLLKNLQSEKAEIKNLVDLYQFILTFNDICISLNEYEGNNNILMKEMFSNRINKLNDQFKKYKSFIEEIFDIDKLLSDNEYLINPKFNEVLQRIHTEMTKLKKKINKEAQKLIGKLGLDENTIDLMKIKGMENEGFSLAVRGKQRNKLQKKKGVIELKTTKYISHITCERLQDYSKRHQLLYEEYKEEQSHLELEAIKIAKSYVGIIEELVKVVCELDILSNFAAIAQKLDLEKPEILKREENIIKIRKGRHLCVERLLSVSDQFIPNDLLMKGNDGRFQLITGPNMGGKSTYIRQNAIIVLLAQIGCYVPAEKAVISIRDGLFTRIGASDYQLRGVSTFMSEMLETNSILRSATPHSLIIIDELGRGTSTFDGFGLAWSISKNIIEKKLSFCLFATHFHELSSLEAMFPNVAKNCHVACFQDKTEDGFGKLTMLYQIKEGHTSESLGIEVAELVKYPKDVVRRAKRKLDQLTYFEKDDQENDQKKRKLERKEESDIINEILKDYAEIPMFNDEKMGSNEEMGSEVFEFREKSLEKMNNEEYSKEFFNQFLNFYKK